MKGIIRPGGERGGGLFAGTGAVAAALLAWGVFVTTTQVIQIAPAWRTFEFCQYAEIGRNLAVDGTFDTRIVEPMALAYIDQYQQSPRGARWPVINRFPLPCYVIAGLFRVAGVSDFVAAASNGLAISLLAGFTFLSARRLLGQTGAWCAAILFLFNPSFFGYFILLGTPDVWFALLFLGELYAFAKLVESPGRSVPWSLATGILAGLAYLARFNLTLFLAVQVLALLARRRWFDLVIVLATFGVVIWPILAYNQFHFGSLTVGIYSGWNLLDRIGAYPIEPWEYYQTPPVAMLALGHIDGVLAKFVTNLFLVVPTRLWTLWHFYLLLPLALWGAFRVPFPPVAKTFFRWSVGLFAWQLIVFSGLRLEFETRLSPHHGRYFFWFAVPALLMGVAMLKSWFDAKGLRRGLAIGCAAVQLLAFVPTWSHWVEQNRGQARFGDDAVRSMLREVVDPNRVVASTQPALLAWIRGLKSVSLPADPVELGRLNGRSPTPVDYLFIDHNAVFIQTDPRWLLMSMPHAGEPTFEPAVIGEYDYVFPPDRTIPVHYVLLRRRGLARSAFEIAHDDRIAEPAKPPAAPRGL